VAYEAAISRISAEYLTIIF